MKGKQALLPLLVFISSLGIYLLTPFSSQVYSDPRWTIQLAYSIIHEGNINLDEYKEIIHPEDYSVRTIDGHQYSLYPMGTPILSVPFVFVYDLLTPNTAQRINDAHPKAQEFIASFILAITAVLLFQIARLQLNTKQSLLVAFIFAFCTSAWSTASRALWQHGPSMLCLSLTLYLLLLAKNKPSLMQYAGLPLAFSFVIRPLNAFSIALFAFYVLVFYRKYFLKFLLWASVVALPFFWMNYATFGSLLPDYYHKYGEFVAPTIERLFGPLISPGRGLFVYSPIFLFSILGIFLKLNGFNFKHPEKVLDLLLVIIIVTHCFMISIWMMWWGGYSTGPRMLSDIIPYLVYFLIPAIHYLGGLTNVLHPLRLGFAAALLLSFVMTLHTATSDAVYTWNSVPNSVDQNLPRLWDWGDPPFLRGFSWIGKILPQRLNVDPGSITLICKPASDKTSCKTTLTIYTFPRQNFKWKVITPPGVGADPIKGENSFERTKITISMGKFNYAQGTHFLGDVKIQAVQKHGAYLNTMASVPLMLQVVP